MRADFMIQTKNNVVTRIGKSSVDIPMIQWNGQGIKWFDDKQLIKKKDTYKVYTINKITGYREDIIETGLTESEAESYCESWGWNYDDGHRSFWIDYEVEE